MAQVFALQPKNPNYPCSEADQPEVVGAYLEQRNLLARDEHVVRVVDPIRVTRNRTRRIETNQRSLILKQFQDWAPQGRTPPSSAARFRAECQFYRTVRIADGLNSAVPTLLHQDLHASSLVLEDVGSTLPGGPLSADAVAALAWFLVGMHHHSQSVPTSAHYRNEAVVGWQMARLFFRSPRPAREGAGRWLARFAAISELMRHALEDAQGALAADGPSLVHGDFSAPNWVRHSDGTLRVVDAEFSFFGPPEFDVGAFLAWLLYTRQSPAVLRSALDVICRGCFRYRAQLAAAFVAVHLCALFETAPRGAASSGSLRRVADAVAAGSLEPLG